MMKIGILALENCMQSSVTGPFDILSVASFEKKRQLPDEKTDLFNLVIITDDGLPVTCFNGLKLEPHMKKEDCDHLDILFIPVVFGNLKPILSNRDLIGWLRAQNKKGVLLCAVCAGVFPVAETRLLDKRKATGDTPPLEYFQHLRIGKARTLLEQTRESVDTIIYATGYEDLSSFRRLFKRITGLSPTAYRKKFSLYD